MATSRLLGLPPEIRNRIYELVLYQPEPISVHWTKKRARQPQTLTSKGASANPVALPATSKLIRQESTQMFYAINSFILKVQHDWDMRAMLRRFSSSIGDKNKRVLQSVSVDIGNLVIFTKDFPPSPINCKLRGVLEQFVQPAYGDLSGLPLVLQARWVARGWDTMPLQLDMSHLEESIGAAVDEVDTRTANFEQAASRARLYLSRIRMQLDICAQDCVLLRSEGLKESQ